MMGTATNKDDKKEIREEVADAKVPGETTYHVDEHIELAQGMYDVPPHVVAGALSFLGANKENYTKAEMQAAIEKSQQHVVTAGSNNKA